MKSVTLPSGWKLETLGKLASTIQYGYTAKAQTECAGPKMLRITDIQNDTVKWDEVPFCTISKEAKKKYLLSSNDIVFARTGATVGKSYLIRDPVPDSVFASYLIRVRLTDEVIPKYVSYFFKSSDYWRQITESQAGIGQPNVNGTKLAQIEIPIAPANQQELIVAEIEKQFSRLDEAVAILNRTKVNLKRYRTAVLKAAVEGKLTEDWRKQHTNVEPAGKLLKQILAERRAKWHRKGKYKEPAAPNIDDQTTFSAAPEGWAFASMEQLLPPMRKAMKTGPFGSLLKKHEHKTEGVAVLGIENIEAMRFVRGSKIHITQKKAEDLVDYKVMPGDVLISRSGTVGEVCVVPEDIGEARISTNLIKVSLAPDGMLPNFFVLLFNGSPFLLNQVSDLCKGSTRSFLNQEILKQLCFVLPPLPEQREIIGEVERRLSVIDELEATVETNLTRADHLRQSILQRAFTIRMISATGAG